MTPALAEMLCVRALKNKTSTTVYPSSLSLNTLDYHIRFSSALAYTVRVGS